MELDPHQTLETRTDVEVTAIEDRDALTPSGYLVVTLAEDKRLALQAWVKQHLDAIETEMRPVLARFEEERHQLEGTMPGADYPYPGAFRVNWPLTKKKVREGANRAKQAYLDSDPIWAVVAGHEPALSGFSQRVEQAMDDATRNTLELESVLSQIIFEARLHGSGFCVPGWAYTEDVRREVRTYAGFDGLSADSLQGLQEFEHDYAGWADEPALRAVHKALADGTDQTKEFSYTAPSKNRPNFVFVSSKDVRAYPTTEGYDGLRTTPLYGYMTIYTRSQMEQFVREEAIDADAWALVNTANEDADPDAKRESEPHEVGHFTIRYPLTGDPERYHVWYERKAGIILRIRKYFWWYNQPDLIPTYIRLEEPGFFKRGIAWDVSDTHIVVNVILSMFLNGVDMANSLRMKAKLNSPAYYHLLARRYSPHLPLPYKDNENEAVQIPAETGHITSVLEALQLMRQVSDEDTGTSNLQSGRESPTDKRAPAAKTLMLLQQVEPTLKEELRSMSAGFQQIGRWVIWLYYQGIGLGWIDEFPGVPDLPHALLPQIAAKLQPRALMFEFDRQQRVERNKMALDATATYSPQNMPIAFKIFLQQLDSQWARVVGQFNFTPPAPAGPSGSGAPAGGPGAPGSVGTDNPTPEGPGAFGGRLAQMAQATNGQR